MAQALQAWQLNACTDWPTVHSHAAAALLPSCFTPLQDIDAGRIWPGRPAPGIAQTYWRLPVGATMRDLILAVRADEACHSHVNHTFAAIQQDDVNPFTSKDSHLVP
jgi:hypothetical protein